MALISDLEIEFGPALNLLTGETGSGKSIIVDSLTYLLGARASPEIIGSASDRAFIEGIFRSRASQGLVDLLTAAGVDWFGDEIIIRRELQRTSPSRAFVNDRLVTASFLRQVRPFLVDIYGQSDYQTLLSPSTHLELVDAYGGTMSLREQLNRVFRCFRDKCQERDNLITKQADHLRLVDVYQFQLAEIEKAQLKLGEDATLMQEKKRLQNMEKLRRLLGEAYGMVYEDDRSMLVLTGEVRRRLEQLQDLDPQFQIALDHLTQAKVSMEELAFLLRDYVDGIEFSPVRLQQIEERLAELDRLKRKYGPTLADVQVRQIEMLREFEQIGSFEEHLANLEKEIQDLKGEYDALAQDLSERRRDVAQRLEPLIMGEMRELAMERGKFVVLIHPVDTTPSEHGVERVEFLISTNPGEPVKPIGQVASGGELSRIMLAIKSIGAEQSEPLVLVFDEIDVGIGGRVAEQVGLRLKRLAATHQVFCVTHQPQIARFADAHYRVQKIVDGERTIISVEQLNHRGRVEELARMLAGVEITDLSRRHARELLKIV